MAFYYVKNQVASTNISLRDLYRIKGVNLNEDKTSDFRLAPYASATQGSQLGPGVNPYLSAFYGEAGNGIYGGMIEFNDPNGTPSPGTNPASHMSHVRNANFKWTPWAFGTGASGTNTTTVYRKTSVDNILDSAALAPNWAHRPFIKWYAINSDDINMSTPNANYLAYNRRSTTTARLYVGRLDDTGLVDTGNLYGIVGVNYVDIGSMGHGTIGLNNVGTGDGVPYNETDRRGGSTYATFSYRNSSSVGQFRVVTLNQNYSATPTISVGAAVTYNNQGGSMLFFHGPCSINMGKGVQWSVGHRGANFVKIYYTRLTGTTVNAHNGYTLFSLTSTNTIQSYGSLVKISDESAVLITPHRNGASSGNSRRISAHTFYANGTGKIPTLRASFKASYDWGSTDTVSCASAVGSSDTDGTLYGLTVWARSGTSTCYFISWEYIPSTDAFQFFGTSVISDPTGYQTNTFQAPHSVVFLGYDDSTATPYNYYQVSFGGDNGNYMYTIEQMASVGDFGDLTISEEIGDWYRNNMTRIYQEPISWEGGMPWFVNKPVANNYSGPGHWISTIAYDTSNRCIITGHNYNLPSA